MAYGMHQGGSLKFVKLQGLGQDSKEHFFEVGENKEVANYIEGIITKIEESNYEYQGKQKELIKIYLYDDETLCLSLSYTKTSRGIFNSILGTAKKEKELKGKFRFYLYGTEKNGKTYKNAGVNYNGQKTERALSFEEQKKLCREVKDAETGEYLKTDFTKLDNYFKDELLKLKFTQPVEKEEEPMPF